MPEGITIFTQIFSSVISLLALLFSILSMRQAKDSKMADQLKEVEERMAEHEKEDAASFSTIKARLHSHRVLLKFLQSIPERIRVLEFQAKIAAPPQTPPLDDDGEDKL